MSDTLFTNVRILDGTGTGNPYSGSVLVQGNRIRQVGRSTAPISPSGATVIDGAGATLMPGISVDVVVLAAVLLVCEDDAVAPF